MTYKGVARGKTIELDEVLPFPEGQRVTVAIEPMRTQHTPGSAAAILEALRQLPRLDPEAVDELERAIEESKLPLRYAGIFDEEDRT